MGAREIEKLYASLSLKKREGLVRKLQGGRFEKQKQGELRQANNLVDEVRKYKQQNLMTGNGIPAPEVMAVDDPKMGADYGSKQGARAIGPSSVVILSGLNERSGLGSKAQLREPDGVGDMGINIILSDEGIGPSGVGKVNKTQKKKVNMVSGRGPLDSALWWRVLLLLG
ncbi:hypothetical protein QYF36_022697 [Acer negundo]|nr:hypothetical protein QYF36_022697 [Acer negundo]